MGLKKAVYKLRFTRLVKWMLFIFIFFEYVLFMLPTVYAQSLKDFSIQVSEPLTLRSVMIDKFQWPSEISPIVLNNPNGQKIYINPGSVSNICLASQSLLTGAVLLTQPNCLLNATVPSIFSGVDGVGNIIWKNSNLVVNQSWKYSYDGIFGASILPGQNRIFFAKTFETQDYINRYAVTGQYECTDSSKSYLYTSGSIQQQASAGYCTCAQQDINCSNVASSQFCLGGQNKCPADLSDPAHDHSWPTFNTGITMGWSDYSAVSGWNKNNPIYDEGPIIWPNPAYTTNNNRTTGINGGIAYGTTIIKDGYIYLYYIADRQDSAQCVQVSRSLVSSKGLPGSWKNYYNGLFNENSLPSGFTKENISAFYEVSGGKADCIFKDDSTNAATWFSVAKLKGTDYFIGVEESSPNYSSYLMGIRFSKDLINWTPLHILDTAATKWGQGNYIYPRFLDKTGSSNTEVDADEFYIYGKKVGNSGEFQGGYIIQSLKLSVTVPDETRYLAMQYFKELLNWQVDYNDSGVIWHANNIKVNGCKADILNFTEAETFQDRKTNFSDPNFIRMLYRAILSREPEKAGLEWYLDLIYSGKSRDWVLESIMSSSEANVACSVQKTIDPLIGDLNRDKKVDSDDSKIIANELFSGSSFYVLQSLIWHIGYYK